MENNCRISFSLTSSSTSASSTADQSAPSASMPRPRSSRPAVVAPAESVTLSTSAYNAGSTIEDLAAVDRLGAKLASAPVRNIIITGANSGVGFAGAKILTAAGHHVTLACRTQAKADAAAKACLAYAASSADNGPATGAPGFYGADCGVYCERNATCSGRGECTSEGECVCEKRFSGDRCEGGCGRSVEQAAARDRRRPRSRIWRA